MEEAKDKIRNILLVKAQKNVVHFFVRSEKRNEISILRIGLVQITLYVIPRSEYYFRCCGRNG